MAKDGQVPRAPWMAQERLGGAAEGAMDGVEA